MATERNYKTIQSDFSLINILERIRDQEEKRNDERPSMRHATKMLAKKINGVGGLK